MTATAPAWVVSDLFASFFPKGSLPRVIRQPCVRPNIRFSAAQGRLLIVRLVENLRFLAEEGCAGQGRIIAFFPIIAQLEDTLQEARRVGLAATSYHGEMNTSEKTESFGLWKSGIRPVMLATSAFGIGIDYPSVRHVHHYGLPASLEQYAQESGRAGRDGRVSTAHLDFDATKEERRITEATSTKEAAGLKRMLEYGKAHHACRRMILSNWLDHLPTSCIYLHDSQPCENCEKAAMIRTTQALPTPLARPSIPSLPPPSPSPVAATPRPSLNFRELLANAEASLVSPRPVTSALAGTRINSPSLAPVPIPVRMPVTAPVPIPVLAAARPQAALEAFSQEALTARMSFTRTLDTMLEQTAGLCLLCLAAGSKAKHQQLYCPVARNCCFRCLSREHMTAGCPFKTPQLDATCIFCFCPMGLVDTVSFHQKGLAASRCPRKDLIRDFAVATWWKRGFLARKAAGCQSFEDFWKWCFQRSVEFPPYLNIVVFFTQTVSHQLSVK